MEMTSEEIRRNYRLAKDPVEQIQILADMNCTTQKAICEILRADPTTAPTVPALERYQSPAAKWEDEILIGLSVGRSVRDMSRTFGLTYKTLDNYIDYHNLRVKANELRERFTKTILKELREKEESI